MSVDKLQKRLRAIHAVYDKAPRPRTDTVKLRAMRQSLGAVIEFLLAQPNAQKADVALIYKVAEAFADVEAGRALPWRSNHRRRPPIPRNIKRKQAEAAAHMELLMRSGMTKEGAARKV